jgi:hypothetical protein
MVSRPAPAASAAAAESVGGSPGRAVLRTSLRVALAAGRAAAAPLEPLVAFDPFDPFDSFEPCDT